MSAEAPAAQLLALSRCHLFVALQEFVSGGEFFTHLKAKNRWARTSCNEFFNTAFDANFPLKQNEHFQKVEVGVA